MSEESASGSAVAERLRASSIAVGDSSPVEAMLANSLRERKPLADDGALYDTVQAAENAASSFVFVPPGTFNESVTIDTAGLTLLGSGRATLIDGNNSGVAIDVTASNVDINQLSVRTDDGSGYSGISCSASDLKVSNIHVQNTDSEGIVSNATRTTVINSRVEGWAARGIRTVSGGDKSKIIGNIVTTTKTAAPCIQVDNDSIIAHNVTDGSDDGIYANNSDNIIIGNRVMNAADHGIVVTGTTADTIVANNRVSDSGNADIFNGGSNTTLDANLTGASN
jgi:parallel beta-helix repeat protein